MSDDDYDDTGSDHRTNSVNRPMASPERNPLNFGK